MLNIFIDTNVYESLGFNFSEKNYIILNFIKQIDNNEIRNVIVSVIDNEVKNHLMERKKKSKSILKKYCKWIKDYLEENVIEEKLNSEFIAYEEFKKRTKSEIINLDTINPELVLEKYFKRELPFENSKQNEFKDAFFIEAVKEYASKKLLEKNIIITNDKGIKNAIKELKINNIQTLSSIQELMDVLLNYNKSRKEELKRYLSEYDFKFKQIREKIIIDESDIEEGNIEIEKVQKMGIWDIEILDANESKITIVCDLGINLKGRFICLDKENSIYNYEENEYIVKTYCNKENIMYVCLTILEIEIENEIFSKVNIKAFPDIEIQYEDIKG